MARPKRTGIDYFSLDVDFFDDEKILPISVPFGAKGEIIVIRLLCAIYREGYFIQWSNGLKFKIANQSKVSEDLVSDVVLKLIKYHFFNEALFKQYQILTSVGIQKRWSEATRKRVKSENLEYWLLSEKEEFQAEETHISGGRNTEEIPLTRSESTQSKVNKSKVNKKKEPKVNYEEIKNFFNETCVSLPRLETITEKRKKSINARIKQYGIDRVKQMIENASESNFLSGQNKRDWVADFNWLFRPENFAKVLEGNYKNKTASNGTKTKQGVDNSGPKQPEQEAQKDYSEAF